jgi:hypothetical protein
MNEKSKPERRDFFKKFPSFWFRYFIHNKEIKMYRLCIILFFNKALKFKKNNLEEKCNPRFLNERVQFLMIKIVIFLCLRTVVLRHTCVGLIMIFIMSVSSV